MTPVYDADNAIDAQLAVHLLAQAGIVAHVFGAALGGAIGELPATDLVRVWIEDDGQSLQARAVLRDWADADIPDEDELDRLADELPDSDGYLRA